MIFPNKNYQIRTSIERIKPGVVFIDSRGECIKLADRWPSGIPMSWLTANSDTGWIGNSCTINAVYLKSGYGAAFPYNMEICYVRSQEDLRTDEEMVGVPNERHIIDKVTKYYKSKNSEIY